jgi:hypothetical protein
VVTECEPAGRSTAEFGDRLLIEHPAGFQGSLDDAICPRQK